MDRSLLPHLPVVVAVARHGGFAPAAAALGMGASAVSHAVRVVEDRLGTPLFLRTTRSVALTDAGEALVAVAGRALGDLGEVTARLAARRQEAAGLLRINAPRLALSMALSPILLRLAARHPALVVEVVGDDALTDIVAGGFDAGIRLGEMIAQDMMAARLTAPFRAIMVATPAYLAARGTPADVTALGGHNCIGYRLATSGRLYAWEVRAGARDTSVTTAGSAIVSDATMARDLALAGLGIAYLFAPLVAEDLAAGRLVEILPQAAITEPGLFLYYPRKAMGTPRITAFLEAARWVRRQG